MSQPQHVIGLDDLSDELLADVLELSSRLKGRPGQPGREELAGRSLGTLFFRGSLRTRTSFEAAVHQLGGHTMNLTAMSDFWELEEREGSVMDGRAPEHVRDAAAVLSHYVDALAIRPAVAGQSWEEDRRDRRIRTWAKYASVPVINMESALSHPLQALADLLTLRESLGSLAGKKLAIVWVHSPEPASAAVVHSLLHGALRSGMEVRLAHPPGFALDPQAVARAKELAGQNGGELHELGSPQAAADGAQVVYARSWRSLETYGNPTLSASQRSRHTDWTVDEKLFAKTDDGKLMHAMPVRRNVEVSDEVLDGPRSLLYAQAANRLHSQKALLARLLGAS